MNVEWLVEKDVEECLQESLNNWIKNMTSCNKKREKVEGYYYSEYEPFYPIPVPNVLTEEEAKELFDLIKEKEKNANVEYYLGDSTSRVTGEILGNKEYELDGWTWTGDLAEHYVLTHKCKINN
ncbi:hypothetical protein EZS27_024863 [termite gut metagenome]|uniref:Uncharacterized protein n=1 Tax=termite gut metagenome TaxID=433724 RepID=A0A5J4QVL5_9ZZZZ